MIHVVYIVKPMNLDSLEIREKMTKTRLMKREDVCQFDSIERRNKVNKGALMPHNDSRLT
jgi:hypothetical protein